MRTNKGNIGQVIGIFNGHSQAKYHIQFQGEVKVKRQYLSTHTIINHNKLISEIVEVGDYVNGHQVVNEIFGEDDNNLYFEIEGGFNKAQYIGEKDIKTILTKESYMANCYKVGGEDE